MFEDMATRADVLPVVVDGKPAGAVLAIGNEVHACIDPAYRGRWMSKSALRLVDRIIDKFGQAVTQVTTEEGRQFVERLGFEKRGPLYVRSIRYGH
jgi:hypothetical protein